MNKAKYILSVLNHCYTTKFTPMQLKYISMNIRSFSEIPKINPKCEKCSKMIKCWSCSHLLSNCSTVCSTCHKIQDITPFECNDFELLSIPSQFDININELHQHYKSLQKQLHPDRYLNKSEKELNISKNMSTRINVAYKRLRNASSRALYLLELNGINKDFLESVLGKKDNELLMEIFETREKIESCSKEELESIEMKNREKTNECLREILDGFKNKDFERAKKYIIKLQYYTKIHEELVDKMDVK